MSSSLIDLAYRWLGNGPGVPKFALPVGAAPVRVHRFGDLVGTAPHDSLRLHISLTDSLHAPVSGMLWRTAQTQQDRRSGRADQRLQLRTIQIFAAAHRGDDI